MRKFISGLLAIAAAAFTGCYESGTDADNTSREARISISPAAIGFDADGRTTDGLAFGTYIVTVNPYGKMYSDWHAELVGTDWATLDYHTASPDGAVEKALRITCSANTDYKRTGTLRVTLSKTGESVDFPITQVGLKPDATLTLSTESDIEMMALEPAEVTVTFETNMPASTVTAELEEGVEWLTCTLDREAGTVVLAASDNTSPTDMREATVTVSAGTEDTSLATRQIKVRQLANETYLFIYGSGIPHFAAFGDAAQMNKNDLVFGLDHYFRSGKVILSTSRTPDAYPRYALTADGKLAVLADAAAEAAAPELTFGIAGMNALRVTIALDDDNNVVAADSKAEFTRISTVNSMPESELAGYPTKEYVTRDGRTKTWMTTGLHWNGGAAMGTYKLGSGLVGGSKTGGYDEAEYSMRNPAYDTEENGGTLKELMMPDGVTTRASVYGRLYSSYETLTGDPAGALSAALLMPFPLGGAGTVVVDAVGNSITLEPILKADLKDYAASDGGNTQAEADHPSLSMQVQGICPYGWHIANMSDWKDLIYAVAESSKSYSDYPVAAATASYGAMTSGNAANVAAHLRCKEWQDAEFNPATVISNGAEAFAFNLYPQGWRLYKSGYDYCANSGNVRFYCLIPMMGQTTASKMALWRAYCTTSADMVFDDGFDVGNGSGAAVRCVKNYENF